jgi:hypothetical protein
VTSLISVKMGLKFGRGFCGVSASPSSDGAAAAAAAADAAWVLLKPGRE